MFYIYSFPFYARIYTWFKRTAQLCIVPSYKSVHDHAFTSVVVECQFNYDTTIIVIHNGKKKKILLEILLYTTYTLLYFENSILYNNIYSVSIQ